MRFIELIVVLIVIALLVFIASIPSCEEQGGRLVRDGTRLIVVGKTLVPTDYYRCEVGK